MIATLRRGPILTPRPPGEPRRAADHASGPRRCPAARRPRQAPRAASPRLAADQHRAARMLANPSQAPRPRPRPPKAQTRERPPNPRIRRDTGPSSCPAHRDQRPKDHLHGCGKRPPPHSWIRVRSPACQNCWPGYRNAPPAAKALIHAAMDARRRGLPDRHRMGCPGRGMAGRCPGLHRRRTTCKGVSGLLTRRRIGPPDSSGWPNSSRSWSIVTVLPMITSRTKAEVRTVCRAEPKRPGNEHITWCGSQRTARLP